MKEDMRVVGLSEEDTDVFSGKPLREHPEVKEEESCMNITIHFLGHRITTHLNLQIYS